MMGDATRGVYLAGLLWWQRVGMSCDGGGLETNQARADCRVGPFSTLTGDVVRVKAKVGRKAATGKPLN